MKRQVFFFPLGFQPATEGFPGGIHQGNGTSSLAFAGVGPDRFAAAAESFAVILPTAGVMPDGGTGSHASAFVLFVSPESFAVVESSAQVQLPRDGHGRRLGRCGAGRWLAIRPGRLPPTAQPLSCGQASQGCGGKPVEFASVETCAVHRYAPKKQGHHVPIV